MSLRKAAQQALEALEYAQSLDIPHFEEHVNALAALRNALAEPEQDDTALLRQALEALEQVASAMPFPVARATITALRERLGEKT